MTRWILSGLICCLVASALRAENWSNWRGPTQNGVVAGHNFPTEWSDTKNVAWKVKLPGAGASTPVVWGDQIVLTCAVDGKNAVLGLDRAGKQRWLAKLDDERSGKHKKATGCNPSAVTDGELIYAYFKSGNLACLDMKGQVKWQHNLQAEYGEDTLWWDLGTSPVLTKNYVVVAVMQTGPSYLVAFDKQSGALAWKQDRNVDAPSEAAQSYSTPIVTQEHGQEALIVLGADYVTCHAAETGVELWRVGGLNPTQHKFFRSIASPVIAEGMVVAPYARADSITGVRLGGSGDVTKTHVAWTREEKGVGADVPTPVAEGKRFYNCNDKGEVSCLDVATGKTIWTGLTEKHRRAYSASPVLADSKLYVTREDGKTFVLAAGDEFKILAANELNEEMVVATPVLVDHQILIRGLEHLYCIGQ
ncbi:MAG: PQQ-like beta-propeller repeat protein [Planctomycetes bacterium]|nr:PQQ-like beta-propeller repeat protein [Planctomycetota bacterium]